MAASGKTFLQIINAVLPRLRESTVASNGATTYSTMIGQMVNAVKTEIELAWEWRDLRDTYAISAVPGTTTYTLTGAGQHAKILDMWNTTQAVQMARGSFSDFNYKFFGVTQVATGYPSEFLPTGLDSSYDLQVDIWPSPSATNALRANLYIPQADLAADATVPLVPNQVLIEGVLAMALAERGDDSGTSVQDQFTRYRDMLASAIAFEVGHDNSEMAWYPA